MQKSVQVFHDNTGSPTHVMLSWAEYCKMTSSDKEVANGLLYNDNRKIRGVGPAGVNDIDVEHLINYLKSRGVKVLPVNCRAKHMADFTPDEQICLEYIIRDLFVGAESSYANTMQSTTAVVDALVMTGRFTRTKVKAAQFEKGIVPEHAQKTFYRNVMALEVL